MKHTLRNVSLAAALVGLFSPVFGATGSVWLSGSTWTGQVDGSTKYTGNSMAAAVNACKNNMSSGTISVWSSGNTNGTISLKSNITLDGTGKTFSGSGTTGVVYAQNSDWIGARNVWMQHNDWYGIYFRTSYNMNVTGSGGTANLTFRIDNCKGGTGWNLTGGSPWSSTSGAHGSQFFETYGINGGNWGTVNVGDRNDGCGVLLNYSTNFSGSTVNATRCDWGAGYAGFRTANTNGKTTVGTVNATSCGRGFFSVSGSRDCTVSTIQTYTTSGHGVWLQTTYNTRVNGGTVRSGNPCTVITAGSGNYISVSCQ